MDSSSFFPVNLKLLINAYLILQGQTFSSLTGQTSGLPINELFFGIKSGDFSDLADKERRRLAGNIQIIAEGERKRPNLIIADKGEGQHPDDFENTFLSLHRGNKNKNSVCAGEIQYGWKRSIAELR